MALAVLLALASCGGSHHSGSSASSGTTTPTPGQSTAADNGDVGTWSQQYLTSAPYSSLLIEVDYISSVQPTQAALETLLTRVQAHCNKPGNVTLVTRALNVPGQAVWTVQQSYDLEQAQRQYYADGAQAVKYYLYVDGHSNLDNSTSAVLAWTYTGTSTGMFPQTLQTAVSPPLVTLQEVEQSVLVHEFGHDLGLVNLGCPLTSNHLDTQHGPHCINQDCAMFWATEAGNPQLVVQNGGTLPDDYDPACEADLKANGGQ
jgi:hypothetical protein